MRRSLLALAVMVLPVTASASPATLAARIQGVLGGLAQTCPANYEQASCYRASGDIVTLATKLQTRLLRRVGQGNEL
ncbi:hypothetical protein [Deinococcus navajonensis]|uniref:Uncharacterized protein n=1 Tax=Deinococcus navajonensis TaxID=309884 RepID=A0ABV8XNE8_9DEIO